MKTALLVEIVVSQHLPRAITFPFIKALLNQSGFEVRWLRFAYQRAPRAETGFELPKDDACRILCLAERTEYVVFSHQPSLALARMLKEQNKDILIGWICEDKSAKTEEALPIFPEMRAIASFFGLGWSGGSNIFEEVVPDFRFEAANEEAGLVPPLPYIICGPDCTYRRSLFTNPYFKEIDLSGCDIRGGCTFCLRPDAEIEWSRPAGETIRRQLQALANAFAGAKEPILVRALGETFLKEIEAFASAIVSAPLPPCDFLVDGRADLLVAREDHLVRALKILDSSPHRLEVALVGIENFSETELLRFNKGTTAVKNLELIRLLLRLEREYPNTFGFRRWGGLSLILMTPWTRLQDLALNLSVINIARIEEFSGKVLCGKLRLMPRLPLYRLAERDGLLLDSFDDPRMDTVRCHAFAGLYPDEKPWRFYDEKAGIVCKVMLHMATEQVAGDAIDEALKRARESLSTPSLGAGFALALVDAQAMEEEVLDPITLIDRAVALRIRKPALETPKSQFHRLDPDLAARMMLLAVKAGIKPVARFESSAFSQSMAEGLHVLSARIGNTDSVFVSSDPYLCQRALMAARRQQDSLESAERHAARVEEGVLLGYPLCCANAFGMQEGEILDQYSWLYVMRRLEGPDSISPLLGPPFLLCEYVPCSLGCEATVARANRLLDALRQECGHEETEALRTATERPWLVFLETEEWVSLEPEEEPCTRFRYRPSVYYGSNALISLVLLGNELVIDETGISILKDGRLFAAFGYRAFLWWHKRVFYRDFWRNLLLLRFEPRLEGKQQSEAERQESPPEKALKLCAFVARALGRCEAFEGFRVISVRPGLPCGAYIDMQSVEEHMTLLVVPTSMAKAGFLRLGPLTLIHPDSSPLDTPHKVMAAKKIALCLKDALKRRLRKEVS